MYFFVAAPVINAANPGRVGRARLFAARCPAGDECVGIGEFRALPAGPPKARRQARVKPAPAGRVPGRTISRKNLCCSRRTRRQRPVRQRHLRRCGKRAVNTRIRRPMTRSISRTWRSWQSRSGRSAPPRPRPPSLLYGFFHPRPGCKRQESSMCRRGRPPGRDVPAAVFAICDCRSAKVLTLRRSLPVLNRNSEHRYPAWNAARPAVKHNSLSGHGPRFVPDDARRDD